MFRRTSPSSSLPVPVRIPGTKPWVNGQMLVSTGLQPLDEICGGGLPLGSMCIILEDKITGFHKVLSNYFIAEGLAVHHSVIASSCRLGHCLHQQLSNLPTNMTKLKKEVQEQEEKTEVKASSLSLTDLTLVCGDYLVLKRLKYYILNESIAIATN